MYIPRTPTLTLTFVDDSQSSTRASFNVPTLFIGREHAIIGKIPTDAAITKQIASQVWINMSLPIGNGNGEQKLILVFETNTIDQYVLIAIPAPNATIVNDVENNNFDIELTNFINTLINNNICNPYGYVATVFLSAHLAMETF
jgi:hypothetical protein